MSRFAWLNSENTILNAIKANVKNVVPDAKIFLFGSRAYGVPTEESDWDILILTQVQVTTALKKELHFAIFPHSVQIGSFINTVVVQENDWQNNPSYYALHQTINVKMMPV